MEKSTSPIKLPTYQAPAVHKAFKLLKTVANSRQHLGISDLALQLGFSKSSTHGLVHALLREGALVQEPNSHKLFLGPAVGDLAFSNWSYLAKAEAVQSTINILRDQIMATVVVGALISNRILIMAAAESADPFKISAPPGTILPLFAGAAGKVFLAAKTDDTVKRLIREKGLPSHTLRSIVDEKKYLAELEQARLKGYSTDDEEYLTGVRAVAVALHNTHGPPMAVWAVGLSNYMKANKIKTAIDFIAGAADKLRHMLSTEN
jgi:DNA-binding IclR family transcriptional regulator